MNNFFSIDPCYFHFRLFGSIHIITTLLTILFIIVLYKNKEGLKTWAFRDSFMRYFIAITMFLNMSILYGSAVLSHTWTYQEYLPLHFCYISGYLFMYALITKNKKLFKYTYFFSFAGPLPAMILPDLVCGMDRFIYWQWFISHHFFMISSVYVLFVLEWKIEKKDALRAMIGANTIFILVFLFNLLFHTNYIMTDQLPEHVVQLFPFVKLFNHPLVWLELAGILSWTIAYIPVYFINKKDTQ